MSVVRQRQSRLLFSSFEGWSRDGISQDILAGLTLAAITIPEQMATAKLGGFEPQIGFYAFIGATIGFVALGAGRRRLNHNADIRGNAGCSRRGRFDLDWIGRHNPCLTRRHGARRSGGSQARLDRESAVDTGDNRLSGWHCRTYHRFAIAEPFRPRQGRWRSWWPSPSDGY